MTSSARSNGTDLKVIVDNNAPHRRRDSSPIGQFILDQSRRSLRAVKARAVSLTQPDENLPNLSARADSQLNDFPSSSNYDINSGSAGVRLLPQASFSGKLTSTSLTGLRFKNVAVFVNVSNNFFIVKYQNMCFKNFF